MAPDFNYRHGFQKSDRSAAAALFDQAFGAKFASAVGPRTVRVNFFADTFMPPFAFCAFQGERLVGIAGYRTPEGSLTGGITYESLIDKLGFVQGNWAAVVFSFYERKLKSGELHMDGIAVDESVRGQGVGTQLLRMLSDFATNRGYASIRLDVIDTNPLAKKLYEKNGFRVTETHRYPYLKWMLGFGGSATLIKTLI